MKIALAQINPTVGAIEGNAELVLEAARSARQADLLVTPELCLSGYPPKDLLLQEGFVAACERAAERLAREIAREAGADLTAVIGCPVMHAGHCRNALVVARGGGIIARYLKRLLPTYDVFDEDRYFEPGHEAVVLEVAGRRIGLSICEDLWRGEDVGFAARYFDEPDPVAALVQAGAEIIVNPSASPFVLGKGRRHRELLARHARAHGIVVCAVNQVGGNDELIFDGHACAFDASGELIAAGPGFEPALVTVDLTPDAEPAPLGHDPRIEATAAELTFRALVLGVRDYCRKTGFREVLLGVSGGIDSAVVAAIASAALGAEQVLGIAMPSRFSSQGSLTDARELCRRLGSSYVEIPIEDAHAAMGATLDRAFTELGEPALGASLPDVTQENLQSRLRGVITMALSNRTGALLLTTGNKSELAVGYCTLYGDMNGGLAVISDVTKVQVYQLARWMNEHFADCGFGQPPIPESTITKPPSAELAPGQLDSDSLPAYEQLDEIVRRYVEEHQSHARIVGETGFEDAVVSRVLRLIDLNEYKRKQLATGLKITSVAFGFGRRFPIARGWHAT
ncbi:MAG: NAD+ synthase [Phycisphaerales bacterium JB037]